ncbi:hypothetical protein, partial [Enterococcus faecium]|uniref:hypothetical protein n=3 Tax=cellular organisms TaxID=131567 RepID=UPI0025B1A343
GHSTRVTRAIMKYDWFVSTQNAAGPVSGIYCTDTGNTVQEWPGDDGTIAQAEAERLNAEHVAARTRIA